MMRLRLPKLVVLRDAAFGTAGAAVDRLAVRVALGLGRRVPDAARDRSPGERLAELDAITAAYGDPRLLSRPELFFVPPALPAVRESALRSLPGGRLWDLSYPSAFEPFHPGARERYLAHRENLVVPARLYAHAEARPVVVCVHGYLGGHFGFEASAFAASWLYALGLDVALAVLPFHGARAPAGRRGLFPGNDPWRTVEGFAHAVHDLRALLAWLRARGAPAAGLFGMSLGGYTTALLATVEPALDFAIPMIPLASLADAWFEHRAGTGAAPPAWVLPRIDAAFRVVSPLARPLCIDPARVLLLAARGDRITPPSHAERLRAHFGHPAMELFPGGHLLQLGRRQAFGAVARFLAARGLVRARTRG